MKYEYWFANLKISGKRKREIRQVLNSAEELYYIEETLFKEFGITDEEGQIIVESKKGWNLNDEFCKLEDKNIQFITIFDLAYPKRLMEIASPPYALYVKGKVPDDNLKTVAIVGARECSPYGEIMARDFAKALASRGIQIISGMARGVDSAGQNGALEVGGQSFGVLGCGVDICYPREKIGLYMELQQQGGVISEFPPGTCPLPKHFPARNRIISGLSDIVLVIEAKEKSGSLITADMALEQGKDVYALPGPVNSRLSRGCNELIKQGAGILLSPEELLTDIGILSEKHEEKNEQIKILLETQEKLVYSCLGFQPQNLDQLISVTKLAVAELLDILMSLELRGLIKEISKNYYVRSK